MRNGKISSVHEIKCWNVEASIELLKENESLLKKLMDVTLGKQLSVTGRHEFRKKRQLPNS